MKARKLLSVLLPSILVLTISSPSPADTILDDFQVNIEPPGHPPQNSPYSVADWATETIYTAWLSQRDETNWDVGLQLFDYDLETLGEASYLNVREGNYDCKLPRLVVGNQGVGAAWIEERAPNRILFRSLDASGNPLSPPVRVEDNYENFARDSLSIAALEDGYVLVWYDERDSSAIYAQIVDFNGNLIGANFPIRPDSTGGIIALEAQNHPDGRVLVSWVTDRQYSRGRWMDADGNFTGEVFNMAEASVYSYLNQSIVRFGTDGNGLIYQYKINGRIYITYLDTMGVQTSPPGTAGWWWSEDMTGGFIVYFPDLIVLPNSEYVKIELEHFVELMYIYNYTMNFLYSSVYGNDVTPWGTSSCYDLCQLNEEDFLYTFEIDYIGMRKYEISTLDSSEQVIWINEPNFFAPQDKSDILAQEDGSFRIIYNNWIGSQPQVYTRYFDEAGIPAGPDTVVSMTEDYSPVMTDIGRLERTGSGDDLVIWPYGGHIFGTTFSSNAWNGFVEDFDVDQEANFLYPHCDVNANDDVMLFWVRKWWYSESWRYQAYFQSFSLLFASMYPSSTSGGCYQDYYQRTEHDIGLRDDGRFLFCYRFELGDEDYFIYLTAGINYNETVSTTHTGYLGSYSWCSTPVLEKSEDGYWVCWASNQAYSGQIPVHIYLWHFDSDGNAIGDPQIVDSEAAEPIAYTSAFVTTDIAVSESGNFAVVWQDDRFDEGDLFCRQFNPDGSTFGREYRVNSDPIGPLQKEPAVAFGPEDRLYFTWTDFRNEGGQGDIFCKVIEWNDALSVQEEPEPFPYKFALYPPSPNPFNATTRITFELPVRSRVTLEVFDVAGRHVGAGFKPAPTPGSWYPPGIHHVLFDGSGLASGVYLARLEAGDYSQTQKMVLLK